MSSREAVGSSKISNLEELFDLDISPTSETNIIAHGKSGTALTALRQFGDQVFASLQPLAGADGFLSHFDYVSKVLHLKKA
ncbi:hypothetical protein [Rhizobium leguminosarum]|uniref:hypothetical protein n=1 Tax=Rhizobium leguminosarum TaxID=384 RepID=UPI001C978F35|nr:hypothetical protein [Rhizobium leguminosarum]MBY5794987.1 hypothetical protein [Rhizobium leguminosarum]